MTLDYPKRCNLAQLPTPLEPFERTSDILGVEFLIKRDDLTGAELSGNKIRKLEFLLADAISKGCDTVITAGGEQSNHCRATALAATRMGLKSVVCLRTTDKENPPDTAGNILLDRLAGAEIVWIDFADWRQIGSVFEAQAARLRSAGATPYVIPEGGSNAVGTWGYIGAMEEIQQQLLTLPKVSSTTIVYASGSGGTGAGLIIGAKLLGLAELGVRLVGINVCDNRQYFIERIGSICRNFEAQYQLGIEVDDSDIEIIDGYVGRGYAKSQPEELVCLRDLAQREAIILDPVYTGKAYFGLVSELANDPSRFGERVIFVHTGGIFGLMPAASQFDELW